MHLAWQIEDVRCLILERLAPQDLARLAQTCRTLFDVATDELWKTINSISPFLSCLPQDYTVRSLQAEDIQRLDFYASKVRNLVLESRGPQKVVRLPLQFKPKKKSNPSSSKSWEELWNEIAKHRPTSGFLSNLRRLRVGGIAEELLIPLIGISGCDLTQVCIKYIHYRQSESVVFQILDRLRDTHNLEYLSVRDGEPDFVPSKLIQQSPLKYLRLDRRINLQSHEMLRFEKRSPLRNEILQKSSLNHLTLSLTREWYSPSVKDLKTKYLPALKKLWLNLIMFKPERCEQFCINAAADSWTCVSIEPRYASVLDGATDCWRRSPTVFLKGLDSPDLDLLNIKFPLITTGKMFLDIVSAANSSCRLRNLTELAFAGGGWFKICTCYGMRPAPNITPTELIEAMNMLLPMPWLKVLRISVAPNLLETLDLQLYKSIAGGLPALEKLWLGHAEFLTSSGSTGIIYHERVPLHHLAAFCSMLPNLAAVSIGTVDGLNLEETPHMEWACPSVKSLVVSHWAASTTRRVSRDLLHLNLRTYFPHTNLAKDGLNPRMWIFEPSF